MKFRSARAMNTSGKGRQAENRSWQWWNRRAVCHGADSTILHGTVRCGAVRDRAEHLNRGKLPRRIGIAAARCCESRPFDFVTTTVLFCYVNCNVKGNARARTCACTRTLETFQRSPNAILWIARSPKRSDSLQVLSVRARLLATFLRTQTH